MTAADAGPVPAIYQAGLDGGEASFEHTAPDWPAFDAGRLPDHRFVAVDPAGAVFGWVAVSPVSSRAVYAGVVEHSADAVRCAGGSCRPRPAPRAPRPASRDGDRGLRAAARPGRHAAAGGPGAIAAVIHYDGLIDRAARATGATAVLLSVGTSTSWFRPPPPAGWPLYPPYHPYPPRY